MNVKTIAAVLISLLCFSMTACQSQAIEEARSSKNMSRDTYRHPYETLSFFDVKPNMTVVEIWPGGGWYAEILAPMLKDKGRYVAAHFNPESNIKFFQSSRNRFEQKLAKSPENYSDVELTVFEPPKLLAIAAEASADRVLTFRNVHNWMRNDSEQAAFNAFFKALKPGGVLGVVEHRAPDSFNLQKMVDSGYVSEVYVKRLARNAGFKFADGSEINSNSLDTKNHPNGVWSLPPTLRGKDTEKESFIGIGESDRMTLKFIKPKD